MNYEWTASAGYWHMWWMVPTFQIGNASMEYDIEPYTYFEQYVCFENATKPSYFAAWVWYSQNNTLDSCRQKSTPNVKPPCMRVNCIY